MSSGPAALTLEAVSVRYKLYQGRRPLLQD